MRVVAILSEKGGAGKTTATVHLATAAHLSGQSVAILDLDPQGSAFAWAERRGEAPEAQAITPPALPGWIDRLAGAKADFVFIDTGRDANNAGYAAAKAADLILVPLRPGGFDFLALARTLDLCALAGKRPFIVLNAVRPGSLRAVEETAEALQGMACELAPVVLHQRADFAAASIAAKTAQEIDPKGKAAQETAELFAWLDHTTTSRKREEAKR